MKKVVRALSFVLVALMLLGILPIGDWEMIESAEAEGAITTEEVEEKIDEIWAQIGNDKTQHWWNREKSDSELIDAGWKRDYLSTVSTNKNSGRTNYFFGANTCFGFATWIEYCLFGKTEVCDWIRGGAGRNKDGESFRGFVNHNTAASCANYIDNHLLKPGDYIRYKSSSGKSEANHSAIIWRVDYENDKVIAIDANNGKYPDNSAIRRQEYSLSKLRSLIVGTPMAFIVECPAVRHKHDCNTPSGDCECGEVHEHKYDGDGVCKNTTCKNKDYGNGKGYDIKGRYYDYYNKDAIKNYTEAKSGTAKPKEGDNSFFVYNKPYISSGRYQVKGGFLGLSKVDLSEKSAVITAEITNHYNNKWYQLRVSETTDPVYVYSENVNAKWNSSISFTGVTAPASEVTAGNSAKTIVKGTVTAQNSTLKEVTAAIYRTGDLSSSDIAKLKNNKDSITAKQASALKHVYMGHAENIGKTSFDLNQWNNTLLFKKLPGNCDYIYVITATDNNNVSRTSFHTFRVNTTSNAVVTYTVRLNVNGTETSQTVTKGQPITLPDKSRQGYTFRGWKDERGEIHNGQYTPTASVTLYAVFELIQPPAAPNLTATTYDLAEGETQTISWNAVANATKYTVSVYSEAAAKVYEQSTSGTTAAIPFRTTGTYFAYVEAFNDSLSGGSGRSANCVTVRVHGPSTVVFQNYDGSIWSTQSVPYNGTADRPTDPSRAGYTFSGWDGSFTNVKADRTITAKYTAIKYKVTFYDADGNVLSAQNVTYNGDTPGSAVEPDAPEKANYTFVGWSTGDWQNVTTSGIKVYPVYVWANEDIPFIIEITAVEAQGDGYWVSYTVENGSVESHTGRVVIAGKTRAGKFITQTESGAMHLDTTPQGRTYSGRLYVPVNSADMATLATVEAYVVDDYKTTKPIAQPDTYLVGSIDGEYTGWMTEAEYASFTQPEGSTVETKTQYRKRDKETITTQTPTYLDWTLVSTSKRYSDWGNWSAWQDAAVTANDLKQVETRQVLVTEAHTEYRYGRWYATNVKGNPSNKLYDAVSSPSFAHANYNYYDASSKFSLNYSAWSSARYAHKGNDHYFKTTLHDNGYSTHYQVVNGYYYWHLYYLNNGSETPQNKYYWEESKQVPATYKTQYRYRTRTEITDYTFEHWTEWSAWSDTAITASSTQQVNTRTLYRVKLPTASQGSTYVFTGEVGESATNKQAILTVYKVDSASDYSNQYIEQVTLGENGSYSFTFDTLEVPSVQTGDYTVALTVEGATEPLYIGTIEAPKPQYTVRFVDEVTGDEIDIQTVSQGSAAIAPDAPVHEGYTFLGWEYGLGNIREDMTIAARYVKKKYTVVFIDGVNLTVTVMNDIPYGEPVGAPEVESPEGYNFIGWQTAEGMDLDAVTGHMIVTAEYEHITHTVTYMSAVTGTDEEGNAIATVVSIQTINHGEYAEDPIGYDADYDEEEEEVEGEEPETVEEDPETIDYEDLNIPDSMYFDGWSEGAEDPVTNDVIVTPILRYFEDAAEINASIEEGLYAGTQRITLTADTEDVSGISVQYRLNTGDGEAEWLDYDLATAPEIEITETCLLEIEVNETDKNGYSATYEYIIVQEEDFPNAPQSMNAAQTDTETVTVSWATVQDADGYMVRRVSDCDEPAEFDVQDTASFADSGVDPLRRYTYTVTAYKLAEKDGANVVLESQPTDEKTVFFFGDNTPVTKVEVTAPTTVIKGSATQLIAAVTPDDAYDTTVIWTCIDGTGEGYVSSDGLFYGISAGTVTVTAKAFDGSEQYDSVEITVQEIDVGTATLTVSSAPVRAGGTATVHVSVSENSLAEAIQFAVLYDRTKLELTNCEAGSAIKNLSPVINSSEEGVIYFNWDSITSLTAGGSLLDLTFKVKADATGPAIIEIPTDNAEYEFLFVNGSLEEIDIATVSGVLDISELLLGDVDGSGRVNIIDANMIRRHAAKLITLEEEQLQAADVNGDGKVNIIDANLIRRYVAHLIDVFPAEN